jgi:thioredoxin-like negative regulator of GroEL
MRIEQIGDWTLEDRLAVGGKPIVVRFFETGGKGDETARKDFLRVAREHPGARFYEVDLVENPSLAQRYQITRAPLVIVFIEGAEVARQAGNLRATTVTRALGGAPGEASDTATD